MQKLGGEEHTQRFAVCAAAASSSTSLSAKAGKQSEWIKAGRGPGAKCCCSSDKSAEEADSHSNLADMEPLLLRGQNYSHRSFCLRGCVRGPCSRWELELHSAAAESSRSVLPGAQQGWILLEPAVDLWGAAFHILFTCLQTHYRALRLCALITPSLFYVQDVEGILCVAIFFNDYWL